MNKHRSLIALLCAMLSITTYAQKDPFDMSLEELMDTKVSSIASGRNVRSDRAASTVTIITEDDIKKMPVENFWELLDTIPGFAVTDDQSSTIAKVVTIRGLYSNFSDQIALLLNGKPIKDATRGSVGFTLNGGNTFPPLAQIARVEIIRGPGSTRHGSNAVSGLINIVTKNAKTHQGTEVSLLGGSFQTQSISAYHGGKANHLYYSFAAAFASTKGHNEYIERDSTRILDEVNSTNTSLTPNAPNNDTSTEYYNAALFYKEWEMQFHLLQEKNQLGFGTADGLQPSGAIRKNVQRLKLKHEKSWTENLKSISNFGYYKSQSSFIESNIIYPAGSTVITASFPDGYIGNPEYAEQQFFADVELDFEFSKNLKLNWATGFHYFDLYEIKESKNFGFTDNSDVTTIFNRGGVITVDNTDDVFLAEETRTNIFTHLQLEYNWDKLTTIIGARLDEYSDFGSTFNPRAAFIWAPTDKVSTRFLYGRAYKTPTFIALYSQANPVSIGNANLKAEFINTYEWGLTLLPSSKLRVNLNTYYYTYNRGITRESFVWVNKNEITGRGGELEITSKHFDNLEVSAFYAHTNAEDDTNGVDLGRIQKHRAGLRKTWKISDNVKLVNHLNYFGKLNRTVNDGRKAIDSFIEDDISLIANNVFDEFTIKGSIRNLFNSMNADGTAPDGNATLYGKEQISDMPRPGRAFYLEISAKL